MKYDYTSLDHTPTINELWRDSDSKVLFKKVGVSIAVAIVFFIGIPVVAHSIAPAMLDGTVFLTVMIFTIAICFLTTYLASVDAIQNARSSYKRRGFVKENNLVMIANDDYDRHTGIIFKQPSTSRGIVNGVRDKSGSEHVTEFGNYTYAQRGSREDTIYWYTYICVDLPKQLPHILLDAKKNDGANRSGVIRDQFSPDQQLSLEGDFNEHFSLYTPKGYEQDALYLFTPDVMQVFLEISLAYDVEIIGNKLYLFHIGKSDLMTKAVLEPLLDVAYTLAKKVTYQSRNYSDSHATNIRPLTSRSPVAVQLERKNQKVNPKLIFVILLMIAAGIASFYLKQ